MGMNRRYAVITLALAAIAVTGCSSPSTGDARDCHDVDAELMASIAEGANATPITPVAAAAVESNDFKDAYIVAMSFDAPGGDEEVGVWAVASLDAPYAPILAVDGFAQQFTDWPGEINGTELSVTSDGVDEAKACLADQ